MAFPWKAVSLGALVLGGVLVVGGERHGATAPLTAVGRVALIGDSYAVGLGPELQKILRDFQFEGRVGSTTRFWAARIPDDARLRNFRPDTVLVSLGVNDGSPRQEDYNSIVRTLHGLGARVVWIAPPAQVNSPAARNAIASAGVSTIPATSTPLATDGLHPRSYAPWAAEIASALGVS